MPIDTIFVPVRDADDQTSLSDAVVDVAGPTGASVVLARTYGEEEYNDRIAELDFESQPSTGEVARRSQSVRNIATTLQDENVEYEVRGVVGEEGDAFVQLAETVGSDLLYIQGEKRTPTGKALFGSTAQTVLLNAPCPVTFIRR